MDFSDTDTSLRSEPRPRADEGVTALYAAHAVGLIRLGFVMLGNRGTAEDVVQDAFLGLYRNWDRLHDPANALPYLRSSVLNGCRTALRAQARGDRRDRTAAAGDGQPPFDSTEAAVLLSEEHQEVLAAVRRLADRQREALMLRYYLGLSTAAAVVALAISLVLVKDIQNGGAVPSNPATSTGLGGVPRYYVALQKFPDKSGTLYTDIVVGDLLTGRTIAKFAPPAHVTFWSVSASADDRTFVVQALSPAKPGQVLLWPARAIGKITASWYEVHLAPGTADPARLTPLPIKPQSWISPTTMRSMYDPATTGVVSTAVSQSGRELAVLDVPVAGREEVKVFSLATGQLLHDWTTDNPSVRIPIAWVISTLPLQALTWIDGDRALAFAALTSAQIAPSTGNPSGEGTLRSLQVAGPTSGDLLADSTPIWSGHLPWTAPFTSCLSIGSWPQQISADGKTVSCGRFDGSRIAFVTNPLTAGATATSAIDYQLKASQGTGVEVLWTNPSGGTLIGVWGTSDSLGYAMPLSFGVISHGTFTPLRLPSSLTSTFQPGVPFPTAF